MKKDMKNMKKTKTEDSALGMCPLAFKVSLQCGCSIYNST